MRTPLEILTLIVLVIIITVVLLLSMVGAVAPLPSAALLIIVVVLFGVIWFNMAENARRRRAMQLLSYLEQALQHNLPLPRIFNALAGEDRHSMGDKRFAEQMRKAREQLESGATVARALSEVRAVPTRLIDIVAAAERVGRLPHVLGRIMHRRRDAIARRRARAGFYFAYPFVVLVFFIFITGMFMVFVVPKFEAICHDFGVKIPWITQVMIEVARVIGAGVFVVVAALLLLMGFVATRSRRMWPELGMQFGPTSWLLDRIPFISRIRAYDALGETFTFAADAIDAGRPFESALAEAAQVAGNDALQRKFSDWTAGLLRGQTIPDAARTARLPALVSGMLATAVRTSDLAEILRFLGRYYASRFSRSREILRAAATPISAIILGLFVLWLALSVFLPMITIIQSISTQGSTRL